MLWAAEGAFIGCIADSIRSGGLEESKEYIDSNIFAAKLDRRRLNEECLHEVLLGWRKGKDGTFHERLWDEQHAQVRNIK
jgi:hypothetical protein